MELEENCTNAAREVPYEANDLQDRRRRDVVAMVRRQQDRWPFKEGRKRFTSKTNMTQMRAVLLNPTYGFTKQVVPTLTQITTPPSDAGPAGGVGPRLQPLPELLPATPSIVVPPPSLSPQLGVEDAAGAELAGDELDLGSWCTPLRARLSGSENSSGQALSRSASEDRMTVHPQEVDLYVTFLRPGADPERVAYSVALHQLSKLDDPVAGEWWQGSTAQLVERLHEKAPCIEDASEITYPDPVQPEYKRQLIHAAAGGLLNSDTDIPHFHVPPDNFLMLQVRLKQMPVPVNEDTAGTSASSGGGRHHPTTTDVESRMHAMAAWLSNKAKEEPGYTAFKAGQHHVQPNASVVASWQFAVRFCEKYSQRHCSAGEASSQRQSHARGTRIKKKDVQDSLGVGSTWMAEAQQAVQILRIYGEGGSTPRPDVIKKCSSLDEKAGARDLLAYLRSQR